MNRVTYVTALHDGHAFRGARKLLLRVATVVGASPFARTSLPSPCSAHTGSVASDRRGHPPRLPDGGVILIRPREVIPLKANLTRNRFHYETR